MPPADQQLLYRDLSAKLRDCADETALAATIGRILKSLLKRRGDAEFLSVVQDMLTEGMAGRPLDEQRDLADRVVQLVIEKRPEVAIAWQALHGKAEAPPVARREADLADLPDIAPPPPAPEAPPAPYAFAAAEGLLAHYVGDIVERRLALFWVRDERFPSAAFRHGAPFFLFDRAFAPLLRRFITETLLVQCREGLERHLYRHMDADIIADPGPFLADKRGDAWKVLVERLTKLAAHLGMAEEKLAAAQAGEATGAEFTEVEIPVTRERCFRVLGVEFTLGRKTTTKRMRVRVKDTLEPNSHELEALTLITKLRNLAADAGIDLPPTCDFSFLRTLLEFDAKKFASAIKEFVGLARHEETSRQYLFDRLRFVDETYANTLSDALILMMFHEAEDNFGFKAVYDLCIGTALNRDAMAKKRPFLQGEVGRRPAELAFQVREALRRRYDEDTVVEAVRHLLDCAVIMSRTRFAAELQAAQGVFTTFPMVFAGDPDEPVFSHVGHILHRALAVAELDVAATLDAVHHTYSPLAARLRETVRRT